MGQEKLNIIIPQWQGGGQDFRTWYGALALRDHYLGDAETVTIPVERGSISPIRENILGYDDILHSMDMVNRVLREKDPARIFLIGGGCDADAPCMAWLNRKYRNDMAVVYIDAHGDLNTPSASASKLYYGMSLRTLMSDGDAGIIGRLASTIHSDQLILCANRDLDPEEIRCKREKQITDLPVERLEQRPEAAAEEVVRKGFRHIYIHLDLDALDSREFALTPMPEPDGLSRGTVKAMLRALKSCGAGIVGFGIFEYTGEEPGNRFLESLVSFGRNL